MKARFSSFVDCNCFCTAGPQSLEGSPSFKHEIQDSKTVNALSGCDFSLTNNAGRTVSSTVWDDNSLSHERQASTREKYCKEYVNKYDSHSCPSDVASLAFSMSTPRAIAGTIRSSLLSGPPSRQANSFSGSKDKPSTLASLRAHSFVLPAFLADD